jgi:hypothetical protein
MNARGYVDAPVFLQVEPDFFSYRPADTADAVRGARVVGMTQKRPQQPRPGVVIVKVMLRLPKAAFIPLRPEAVVVIPESLTTPIPVEVEATDPDGEA